MIKPYIIKLNKIYQIMKIEFNSCAKALRWIMLHTKTELDFQNLREQLDLNYLYTGQFFIYSSKDQ